MPAPPPPPPPPLPPPPLGPPPPLPPSACPSEPLKLKSGGGGGGGGGGGRNALLADIQKGARLKKVTQVNDRSAPSYFQFCVHSNANSGGSSGGPAPMGPSLGGLFAAGFPTLRPTGQRDLAVSRSSSSASVRPLWNPPTPADTSSPSELQGADSELWHTRCSPSSASRNERPAGPASPLLPSSPAPVPGHQAHLLPIQHSYHNIISQPSTPPPPPPPPFQPPKAEAGDRKSGCFYPLPPSPVHSEPSRFSILRDSPLGPPPPPPAPPLPASFGPSCPSTLPPPPPKLAAVPSPAMRSLPPSYPCNAPTRRPPAVPRSAGVGRLPPPPAPPARSPSTELSCRTPPPPPPPPLLPLSLRNGHLHSLDNFESKFQFHPVEDFPPPDEFKPFPRIYPSKENRGSSTTAPGNRTHLR
uniref:WH2 domain-containing protein n=1 Tax=Gasterosteus aculeatus aculeatus TaxID=481459 RepID=G3NVE1_GASAC